MFTGGYTLNSAWNSESGFRQKEYHRPNSLLGRGFQVKFRRCILGVPCFWVKLPYLLDEFSLTANFARLQVLCKLEHSTRITITQQSHHWFWCWPNIPTIFLNRHIYSIYYLVHQSVKTYLALVKHTWFSSRCLLNKLHISDRRSVNFQVFWHNHHDQHIGSSLWMNWILSVCHIISH